MRKINLLIAFILIGCFSFAQKLTDDFSGKWKAPKGAIIIVSKYQDSFIGKTELEGAVVLKDVKFSDNKWTAIVMNPKENKIAKCELLLEKNTLKITAKKGVLHKTIIWTKQ